MDRYDKSYVSDNFLQISVHPSESYHLLKVDWNWLHWHHRWWLWIHLRNHSHFLHDLPLLLSHGLANALLFKFRKDFLLGF